MPKKLLTDELAELLNPAPRPEADPEAADAGHDAAAFHRRRPAGGDGEDGGDTQAAAADTPAALDMGGRLRMRAPLEVDAKYSAGKRVTRREVFGDDDGGSDEEDEDDDDDDDEEDDEGSIGDGEADEEQGRNRRAAAPAPAAKRRRSDDDEDEEEDEEEDEDDEDDDESGSDDDANANADQDEEEEAHLDEAARLEREYARAEAEGARIMAASAGDRARREAAKGAAVRAQLSLWERSLEQRIHLQKAVAGCNRLPRPNARSALRAAAHADRAARLQGKEEGEEDEDEAVALSPLEEVERAYSALAREGREALAALLELHGALVAQHPGARAAAAESGAGASLPQELLERGGADAAWEAAKSASDGVAAFRDAALDKWHRRTVGGGGGAGGSSGRNASSSLRLLGQDVSAQVSAVMRDGERAARRSQLPRLLAPRPLGAAADPAWREPKRPKTGGGDGADNAADDEEDDVDARDPETFDDGEFYQQLLRELLDGANGGGLGGAARAAGAAAAAAAAAAKKRRRLVDRRASKGRRIRYHVHEKLVGFMARADGGGLGGEAGGEGEGVLGASASGRLPFAEQLFKNLFGGPEANGTGSAAVGAA
jgi:protein AATF/BFR2